MTTYFVNSIGPYAFAAQVATVEEELVFREQTNTIAGRGGRFAVDSLFDGLLLNLTGMVLATDVAGGDPNNPASLRQAWDTIKAALIQAGSLPLRIDSDRFCNVRLAGALKASAWDGLPSREYSVSLVSREDPPWWAGTATGPLGPFGTGATNVTAAGTGPADPLLSVIVTSVSPGNLLTFLDGHGNHFTLNPDVAGTYLVDTRAETVTLAGVDKMATFDGDFLRLQAGLNTLTFSAAGGAAATWTAQWNDRFY